MASPETSVPPEGPPDPPSFGSPVPPAPVGGMKCFPSDPWVQLLTPQRSPPMS